MPMAAGMSGIAQNAMIAPSRGSRSGFEAANTTGISIMTARASHLSCARSIPLAFRHRRTSDASEATAAAAKIATPALCRTSATWAGQPPLPGTSVTRAMPRIGQSTTATGTIIRNSETMAAALTRRQRGDR